MDLLKVFLISCIAGIIYYLLLQWPPTSVEFTNKEEDISYETPLNDSKGLLTPLEIAPTPPSQPNGVAEDSVNRGDLFQVENNVLSLLIRPDTGAFISSDLKDIKLNEGKEENFKLLGFKSLDSYFANSGFFTKEGGFLSPYFYDLSKKFNEDGSVVFVLQGVNGGFSFVKRLAFLPGKYSVEVSDTVSLLPGQESSTLIPYAVIERSPDEVEGGSFAYAYLGPVFSSEDNRFEKVSFDDLRDSAYRNSSVGGWVAMIQHYFLSAWVPSSGGSYLFQAKKNSTKEMFSAGYTGQPLYLDDTTKSVTVVNSLFVGPKLTQQLDKLHPDLGLVVDYGFLWWLGKPIYWLLGLGFDLFKNWGFAIIFLTVVLKILLWPLSAAAYKSMGKMRVLAPKLQSLQASHGEDKQKMGQAMMELYKKEGVNPLGGCLPMLAQMPFFIAFYWVLIETVELRHSPFIFWITDLSSKDPFFVLPLLNAAGMYYSQKLTPTPPNADPMQAQMMKYFPVVFAVIFAWFPAGLVLYWLINMLVTLIQQWWYYRKAGSNVFGGQPD